MKKRLLTFMHNAQEQIAQAKERIKINRERNKIKYEIRKTERLYNKSIKNANILGAESYIRKIENYVNELKGTGIGYDSTAMEKKLKQLRDEFSEYIKINYKSNSDILGHNILDDMLYRMKKLIVIEQVLNDRVQRHAFNNNNVIATVGVKLYYKLYRDDISKKMKEDEWIWGPLENRFSYTEQDISRGMSKEMSLVERYIINRLVLGDEELSKADRASYLIAAAQEAGNYEYKMGVLDLVIDKLYLGGPGIIEEVGNDGSKYDTTYKSSWMTDSDDYFFRVAKNLWVEINGAYIDSKYKIKKT